MVTILQGTLQARHGQNTTIDLHNNQGGSTYAFDVLMALQKPAMESRLQQCYGVQFKQASSNLYPIFCLDSVLIIRNVICKA
jgi:hypothetical protein